MPRQGLLLKDSGEFLFTLWYSVPDAETGKHVGASSHYNCAGAVRELNPYNMPSSVSELVPLFSWNVWGRLHTFAKQKGFDTQIKHKGLRSRNRRLTNYQPQIHVQIILENHLTPDNIHLTTFQQRQGVLPDSSISNNCHVFMCWSPIDNRLSDVKSLSFSLLTRFYHVYIL